MICQFCGKHVDDSDEMCKYCGSNLKRQEQNKTSDENKYKSPDWLKHEGQKDTLENKTDVTAYIPTNNLNEKSNTGFENGYSSIRDEKKTEFSDYTRSYEGTESRKKKQYYRYNPDANKSRTRDGARNSTVNNRRSTIGNSPVNNSSVRTLRNSETAGKQSRSIKIKPGKIIKWCLKIIAIAIVGIIIGMAAYAVTINTSNWMKSLKGVSNNTTNTTNSSVTATEKPTAETKKTTSDNNSNTGSSTASKNTQSNKNNTTSDKSSSSTKDESSKTKTNESSKTETGTQEKTTEKSEKSEKSTEDTSNSKETTKSDKSSDSKDSKVESKYNTKSNSTKTSNSSNEDSDSLTD